MTGGGTPPPIHTALSMHRAASLPVLEIDRVTTGRWAVRRTCEHCGQVFEAKRRNAKYCCEAHRVAAGRARRSGESGPDAVNLDDVGSPSSDLVDSVRRDLEQAGVLETYPAQLALQLAKRLAQPEESGIAGLSKELRTVMAAALEGAIPSPADAGEPDPPDELEKVRRAREAKAREAARRA